MKRFVVAISVAAMACVLPALAADAATASKITGVLTKVEDAGYPMFWLGITPEGKPEEDFLMNNEAAKIEGQIESLKDKKVEAEISSAPSNVMVDLMGGGKSIAYTQGESPESPPETISVTGILSGAAAVTSSDLPDEVTVTPKDGKPVTFEWYVMEEAVKFNGKDVTLLYVVEQKTEVTAIKLAK